MNKEVLLTISGLQFGPDSDSDTVELISKGEYYFRNNKHFLLYDEVVEGFDKTTKNIIKASEDCVEVTKKGVTNVHMVFEKNKKNVTYYYTPYGSISIGVEGKDIKIDSSKGHMNIEVSYSLDLNYEHVADCQIKIEVKPKGEQMNLLS